MSDLPFRWNLARREQLGRLVEGPPVALDPGFVDGVRECCAKAVAQADDSRLVFVGRSPESLYDYLCGALAGTSWEERPVLLNVSMRDQTAEQVERENPEALRAIHRQFRALGLSPAEIAAGERPVALIDLLGSGSTFGNLVGLLEHWSAREGVDVAAVKRRMRLVGINPRRQYNRITWRWSPAAWRWYQWLPWAKAFARSAVSCVTISPELFNYLADEQDKVARSNPPIVWGSEHLAEPPREKEQLEALRFALALHERARERDERERFAAGLAARPEMRNAWLRRLVLELRRG